MVYLSTSDESATGFQLDYILVDRLNLACSVLQLNKLVNQRVDQLVFNATLEHKNQIVLPNTKCFNLRAMRASGGLCLRKGDFQNHLAPR